MNLYACRGGRRTATPFSPGADRQLDALARHMSGRFGVETVVIRAPATKICLRLWTLLTEAPTRSTAARKLVLPWAAVAGLCRGQLMGQMMGNLAMRSPEHPRSKGHWSCYPTRSRPAVSATTRMRTTIGVVRCSWVADKSRRWPKPSPTPRAGRSVGNTRGPSAGDWQKAWPGALWGAVAARTHSGYTAVTRRRLAKNLTMHQSVA